MNIEMWRDLVLGAGVVILTIFCPPAGAVAGVALAGLDMYSAGTGKDWGTGRELGGTERGLRAGFALFDLIPDVGYVNDLAKSGSKVAAKEFLEISIQKGLAQGTKNIDNFKGALKSIKGFGDNVLKNMDAFGKQLDTMATSKVTSVADNLAAKLRHADSALSDTAQNFRLNFGMEPQLVSGAMPNSPGKLSGLADNLQSFAKNLDGSVDEVVESTDALKEVSYGEHITKGLNGKKQLVPNIKYTSEVGYEYTTDSFGRIVSVEAEELILDKASRNLYSQRTVGGADRLADDDGGHLIASMFNGSGDIDNLVAMHKSVNRSGGEWYAMEQEWRNALEEIPPRKVSDIKIKLVYSSDSVRPARFKVSYKIEGGIPVKLTIKNFPKRS